MLGLRNRFIWNVTPSAREKTVFNLVLSTFYPAVSTWWCFQGKNKPWKLLCMFEYSSRTAKVNSLLKFRILLTTLRQVKGEEKNLSFYSKRNIWILPSQNSPKLFCPKDRVLDIEAIYNVIDDAKQFVYIAVMDYLPIVIDTNAKRWVSMCRASMLSWCHKVCWRQWTHRRLVAMWTNFLGPNSALIEISESSAIDLNRSRIGT